MAGTSSDITAFECRDNQVADPLSGSCSCPRECTLPMVLNEMTCECEHVSALPGGVAPPGSNPNAPAPITETTAEPMMMFADVIDCIGASCECSGNGPCTILCDREAQCKDATLKCANNHDCSISCGENACNKALIVGPDQHDFWMYCELRIQRTHPSLHLLTIDLTIYISYEIGVLSMAYTVVPVPVEMPPSDRNWQGT